MKVELLTAERVPSLNALFEAASCPCFCRYWHFDGTKNEWLDRCAERRGENARELEDAVRRADQTARGLVALEGDRVVGWMKITRREALSKLRRMAPYRDVATGDDASTYAIGCFLVDPEFRGKGVARALVAGACRLAPSWGASAIEAYPRRSSEPMHPEEAWMGPEVIFRELGFQPIAAIEAYPVYRLAL